MLALQASFALLDLLLHKIFDNARGERPALWYPKATDI